MRSAAQKAALRQRRAALRAQLAGRRAKAKAALAARRKNAPKRRRRWLRWVLLAMVLLLLLFLQDCRCADPVPPPATGASAPAGPPLVGTPEETTTQPVLPGTKVRHRPRPAFELPAPAALPWLAAFRLQVVARSPRLAQCFVGADRPGALKWTGLVSPADGRVSDQSVESTLGGLALSSAHKACVTAVIQDPLYELEPGTAPSTPSRVSLVIEF